MRFYFRVNELEQCLVKNRGGVRPECLKRRRRRVTHTQVIELHKEKPTKHLLQKEEGKKKEEGKEGKEERNEEKKKRKKKDKKRNI